MAAMAPAFLKLVKNPFKFRLFLFSRLPSAFFSGVRVREMDETTCTVSVPYKWFSQNPFRSTYFACLAMAGEMSTGLLAMGYLYNRQPAVSMLVVRMQAEYYKKATGRTIFSCVDGALFQQAIDEATASGEARSVTAKSTGKNEQGELVAEFTITWSFKAKTSGQ